MNQHLRLTVAFTCLAVFAAGGLPGCEQAPEQQQQRDSRQVGAESPSGSGSQLGGKTSREARFAVEGMTCEGCASAIEGKVAAMEGVRFVEVSLEENVAVVGCEAGVEEGAIATAIGALGYKARPLAGAGVGGGGAGEDGAGGDSAGEGNGGRG